MVAHHQLILLLMGFAERLVWLTRALRPHRALRSGFPKNVSFLAETSDQAPPFPLLGTSRKYILLAAFMLAFSLCVSPLHAVTLTYKDTNKWVAEADNKPLLTLMQAAEKGQTHFKASLPAKNRDLSIQRLIILRDILSRKANQPVVIEETGPAPKANTLIIN